MKAVGLQTFIWQNNIKSIVLLELFPFLLSIEIFFVILSINLAAEVEGNALLQTYQYTQSFFPFIVMLVLFWFAIAFLIHKNFVLNMAGAKELSRMENPKIYNIVENLSISRGLPVPKIYEIPDNSMNAFATGWSPKNAVIAFSRGILEKLDDSELEAVAAHELTHIINRDIRLMTVAIVFVGIITTIAEIFLRMRIRGRKNGGYIILIQLLVFILGYFISVLIQFAISRKREYLADAGSVELTKQPEALIDALTKISGDPGIEAIKNRQMAQICIENPVAEIHNKSFLDRIFSTHPPISDRIKAIKMIGGT